MLKIAHFSDLHYAGGANLNEVDRCFSFAVDRAIAEGVHCAVISGDATDHALDMHSPAVMMLVRQIRRLTDHCPVLMLQGTFSHEPPGTLNIFRLLGGVYPVHVADRISQVALLDGGQWVESEGWLFHRIPAGAVALFSCVPTVNKAVVGAAVGATHAAEAVGEQLSILLRGFQPANDMARASNIPTIGVSHGTVYGCVTEHGVPMAGFDHEFTAGSLMAAGCSAFMLGHIHMHQSWEADGRLVAYAGSIGRLHYGELGDKGYLSWEVDANGAAFTLVPTPAKRTIEISFDQLPDMDALRERASQADIAGAFVRVRWNVPEEDRHQVDRDAIEALFDKAAGMKIEGRIIPVVRSRAAGISQAPTMAAKLQAWAEATETDPGPMVRCLEDLQSETPEAIAQRILHGIIPAMPVQELAVSAMEHAPSEELLLDELSPGAGLDLDAPQGSATADLF